MKALLAVIVVGCAASVAYRTATAVGPPAPRTASSAELETVAVAIASSEDEWREKALRAFAGDDWSQNDDFHARERAAVYEAAVAHGISPEEVLRGIDSSLHRRASSGAKVREVHAVPCKPRPFYD